MSYRTHWTAADNVVITTDRERIIDWLDEPSEADTLGPCIAIDDGGNQEAMVIEWKNLSDMERFAGELLVAIAKAHKAFMIAQLTPET